MIAHQVAKPVRGARDPFKTAKRALSVVLIALPLSGAARPVEPDMLAAPLDEAVNGWYDYAGLIHTHTAYSKDATGSYQDLAAAAARQGIRFIVVTDHNTLGPGVIKGDGWRNGVLMLTGLESSRSEGHLLAFGTPSAPLGAEVSTDELLSNVTAQGGTVALAHPTHRRWAWKGPVDDRIGAMEIVDLADQFYAASPAAIAATLGLIPFVGSNAYLRMAGRPDAALALWDRIGERRRMVGFYGPDIHQSIRIAGDLRLPFPRAADLMRLGRNHILTTRPMTGDLAGDRTLVLDAVARGRLYVSFDILGDGRGFGFTGERGGSRIDMGDETTAGDPIAFSVAVPDLSRALGAETRLLRDGEVVATSSPGATAFSYVDARPGVYRVEVVVPADAAPQAPADMVWIYSNPVYVRARASPRLN